MRIKSSIVKWNFRNFWSFDEDVASEINEQSTNSIFASFDVNLNVNNEKCKRFDVVDAIVAKMTNEINEFLDRFENVTNLKSKFLLLFLMKLMN